jgi:integrase
MDVVLYQRPDSPYWWMRWYIGGKLYRESTRTGNKKKARKILKRKEDELLRNMGIVDADTITLKELIDKVIEDYKYNNKRSLNKVEQRAEILYDFFGKEKVVVHILAKDIEEYTKNRHDKNKKPSTINRELALLKRGFNLLKQNGIIGSVPHFKMLSEDNVRRGFFEHWEYKKLMEKASEHIKPLLTFLYHTGWRLNEALNLTWDMVDVDNGVITLPPGMTKNRKGRHYYMPDNVCEMVRNLWSQNVEKIRLDIPTPNYVFTNKEGSDRMKDIRGAWKNSCERAGLEGKLIHDFRRTAARNYVRAGVPERVAQELLGQQTPSIFSRYNIVSDTDFKTAAKKMTEFLNNQGENKPVETHPHGFREWEPSIKAMMDEMEKMKKDATKYLMDKYGSIIEMDKDGRVVQIDKDGKVTELNAEQKDKK